MHQFFLKIIALQWIFAFTIMGTLFIVSVIFAAPGAFGKEIKITRPVVDEDRERQPLLNDTQ